MQQAARPLETTFDGFEQLREVVPGTRREIIQIEPGRLVGRLLHAEVGDLPVDAVSFSLGVRSCGEYPTNRITLSMLMASHGGVTHSTYRSLPGDVVLTPPGGEQENRYAGATSLVVTSITLREIEKIYGTEQALASLNYGNRAQFKGSAAVVPRIMLLLDRLKQENTLLSGQAASFWKRAMIDAMLVHVIHAAPSTSDGPLPSAVKLVRLVDEFLEADENRVVHISEICRVLQITRRTLHRAFHEVVGVGPIGYLRFKRLCAIHTALRSGSLRDRTIEDIAFQHGFLNAGRFSQYYRRQFGCFPAETRLRAGLI